MVEITQEQVKEVVESARLLAQSVSRYQRHEESYDLNADAGDNTVDGTRVGTNRILVVTHMWAYDATSAPTYIRLGYWNRARYVWVKIEPAPLVLETVNFYGELYLQEDMWPAVQGNGITANDDIYGGLMGYWIRAPRMS